VLGWPPADAKGLWLQLIHKFRTGLPNDLQALAHAASKPDGTPWTNLDEYYEFLASRATESGFQVEPTRSTDGNRKPRDSTPKSKGGSRDKDKGKGHKRGHDQVNQGASGSGSAPKPALKCTYCGRNTHSTDRCYHNPQSSTYNTEVAAQYRRDHPLRKRNK
jgi:hypothetical protein